MSNEFSTSFERVCRSFRLVWFGSFVGSLVRWRRARERGANNVDDDDGDAGEGANRNARARGIDGDGGTSATGDGGVHPDEERVRG